MSAHTPAPWVTEKQDGCWQIYGVNRREPIADQIGEQDARLISAAPDLLWALQSLTNSAGGDRATWEVARAAIAKATVTTKVARYPHASDEPLESIRRNECEAGDGHRVTRRFQALWNEIERLRHITTEAGTDPSPGASEPAP